MIENNSSHESYDIDAVNSMLRGELAAVESYNQAIYRVENYSLRRELENLRDEHQKSVCALRHWVRELKESPATTSGVWGYFTAAVTCLAGIGGELSSLSALERGERHGESSYRAILGSPDLPDAFRHLVGARLLPQCQAHSDRLERLADFYNPVETSPS